MATVQAHSEIQSPPVEQRNLNRNASVPQYNTNPVFYIKIL